MLPRHRRPALHRARAGDRPAEVVAGAVLLGAGAAVTAAVALPAVRAAVQAIDDGWYRLVQRHRSPSLDIASRLLDVAMGTTVDWTVRTAVTARLVRDRRWQALASWAATIALGEVCIGPLKGRIARPRPAGPVVRTTMAAYPSGHAIAAATTCPGAAIALLPPGRQRDRCLQAAFTVAAATALSRTYLNAHWLSDAVGGFCLGTAFSLLTPHIVGWSMLRPDDDASRSPGSRVGRSQARGVRQPFVARRKGGCRSD